MCIKTGHGPHSSKTLCCSIYCLFCVVPYIVCFVLFCVLFVLCCSIYSLFCVVLCIACFVLFCVLFVLCCSIYCLFCVVLYIVCFVLFYILFVLCCSIYCLFCVVLYIVCFVLFCVLFVLCRSFYCLYVNVYCTTATGWLPNCGKKIYHIKNEYYNYGVEFPLRNWQSLSWPEKVVFLSFSYQKYNSHSTRDTFLLPLK